MWNFNKRGSAALLCGAALMMGVPIASAQDPSPDSDPDSAQGLAVQGLRNLMQALELFVKSVPQYAAPEVLPNGDIIIRRVHPSSPDTAPKAVPDETHT
jgi:hypothetical protein